jgi:hypothetical protein
MVELIEGGFLAQTILVILVWGGIVFLAVTQHPIPDPLLDAGFVIVGFYFHAVVTKTLGSNASAKSQENDQQTSVASHS